MGCRLCSHDRNALATFEDRDDEERRDWGKRLQPVVEQHVVEIQDFEEWETGMRLMSHWPADVGKALEHFGSVVCRSREDCIRHIVLDPASASAVPAIHQALVVVKHLSCLPVASLSVSRGWVVGKDYGRRARDCERRR